MKPVFQQDFTTHSGDCMTACVASILEMPLDEVPNFVCDNNPEWWHHLVIWLVARGYHGVWLINNPPVIPLGYHIAGCDRQHTEHGEIGHVVVAHDGVPVHCPVHGNKPRIPDRIHEWFLILPFDWPLKLQGAAA